MSCEACGCGSKRVRFCPVSLGLAIGITFGLAVFIWSIWVMYYGVPATMASLNLPVPTWSTTIAYSLLALVKGFIFGLVVAFIYNGISCCCKCKHCKTSNVPCGCSCCSTTKSDVSKPLV